MRMQQRAGSSQLGDEMTNDIAVGREKVRERQSRYMRRAACNCKIQPCDAPENRRMQKIKLRPLRRLQHQVLRQERGCQPDKRERRAGHRAPRRLDRRRGRRGVVAARAVEPLQPPRDDGQQADRDRQ